MSRSKELSPAAQQRDVCAPYEETLLTGTGHVCSSPGSYFFWDEFHPTATIHTLFGQALYAAVIPEPATWLLFGSGIAVLVGMRRRWPGLLR
jgi:PEP-CTERM putative exosortase interaction domain